MKRRRRTCDELSLPGGRAVLDPLLPSLPEKSPVRVTIESKTEGDEPFNGLLLSESALAKDWNTPEEDAAWVSL